MSFLHLCNRSSHQEAQAPARKTVTSALVEEILANAAQVGRGRGQWGIPRTGSDWNISGWW